MKIKKIRLGVSILLSAVIIVVLFSLTSSKANAQTVCDAEGGVCMSGSLCSANCNTCNGYDNGGNRLCPGGQTCCDQTNFQYPSCNTGYSCNLIAQNICAYCIGACGYTSWNNNASVVCGVVYDGNHATRCYSGSNIVSCNPPGYVYYPPGYTGHAGGCAACGYPYCGDGSCNNGETCASCPQDCGVCNYTPIGWFDGASYTNFAGWTCDQNNYNASLQVDFYADGNYIGSGIASASRQDVANAGYCGGNPNHGFSFNPQTQFGLGNYIFNGNNHTINAYAINIPSGSNPQLGNPITITNAAPIGWFDNATYTNFYGWTCDSSDYSQTLNVTFYRDGPSGSGTLLGTVPANVTRGDVASSCGGYAAHGFNFDPGVQFPNNGLFDGNSHTVYAYASNWPAGAPTQLNNSINGQGFMPIAPYYTISGYVFNDYNAAQKPDYGTPEYIGNAGSIVIRDNNGNQVGATINVAGDGSWTTPAESLAKGTYTVSFTPAAGLADTYTPSTPTVFTVNVGTVNGNNVTCGYGASLTASCIDNSQGFNGSIQNLDFGLTSYYIISGLVYDDLNIDQYYTPTDQNGQTVDTLITTGTVTASGPMNATATVDSNGQYKFTGHTNGLIRGTYTLTYNPTGSTQRYIYPPNYQTQVTVGKSGIASIAQCNPGTNHNYDYWNGGVQTVDTTCDANGNITTAAPDGRDLNFGINNTDVSYQSVCMDMRITGFTDHLPATGTCGGVSNSYASLTDSTECPTSPGIVFCQNGTCDFGDGQASVYDWQVGTPSYPEVFQPVNACIIRTSVPFLTDTISQNGITTTDLTSICPVLSSCALPANLPNGIYTANGDVTLNGYTFPANGRHAFIINGNLTIMGNIIVPVGAVAAFSVADNIYIDKSVGVVDPSISCDPQTQLGCNVEGLYSAGQSIIIQSARTSPNEACNFNGSSQDLRINLAGSFVSGADCTSNILTNQRDLCKDNTICPVQTITDRGDILLNAYSFNFLLHKNSSWKEITP